MQRTELGEEGVSGAEIVVDRLELRALHPFAQPRSDVLHEGDHPLHFVGQRLEQPPARPPPA